FLVVGALALIVVGLAIWQRAWRVAPPLMWLLASIVTLNRLTVYFGHYAVLVTPSLALLIAFAPRLIASAARKAPAAQRGHVARVLSVALAVAVLVALAQSASVDFSPVNARDVGSAPNTTVVAGIPPGAQSHMAAINALT